MKNANQWAETKFVSTPHGLRGSRNPNHLGRGSRFIGDIQAQNYERAIRKYASGRLLDLGCGHVPLYGVYRDLVNENVCVDWENTLHVNPYLDMTADLTGELPFPSSSFDTIIMTDVLEHLPEPLFAMNQVSKVLRPGGKLILGVPFFYWLHEKPHDFYRYTEFALRRFCELSGLSVLELWSFGGILHVLIDVTSKGLAWAPRWLEAPVRPIHSAVATLNSTSLARKISNRTKDLFPLGYMMVAGKPPL